MGILMPYYLTDQHIYVPGTKNNFHPQFFSISILKWNIDKYGSQDIFIIGIASFTIAHDRKSHIPFFSAIRYFFSCWRYLYLHSIFKPSRQIQCFKGTTCALESAVYAHPTRTGGKILCWFFTQYLNCSFFLHLTSALPPWACCKLARSLNLLYQIFL